MRLLFSLRPHSSQLAYNTDLRHIHILLCVFVAAEAGVDEQLTCLVLFFFVVPALVEVISEKAHLLDQCVV